MVKWREKRKRELVDILSLVVEFYSLMGEECYVHIIYIGVQTDNDEKRM